MNFGSATVAVRVLGAIAAIVLTCAADGQQDDVPLIVSPRPELKWLELDDIELALVLEWRRDVDTRDDSDGERTRDQQDRFREILEGATSGFVGHPNLLTFDASGSIWFTQRLVDFDSNDFSGTLNDLLFNWNVAGTFVPNTKVPLTIYSRQNTSDFDRQFGGTLESMVRQTGIIFNWRDNRFPTNIHAFRREQEQVDAFRNEDFNSDQYTIQADGLGVLSPRQRIVWDFGYDNVDEEGDLQTPRSRVRIRGNATHTFDFGENQASQFLNRFHIEDNTGDIEFQNVTYDSILRLYHSEDLRSWFDYRFRNLDRPTTRQTNHTLSSNFRHQLFDSLITTGRAGVFYFDIPTDGFDSYEVFGQIRSDYTKEVPGGVLLASADLALSHLDQSERGSPIDIIDAPFQFNAANLIVINDENILASSIVVTDVTGLIEYREGPDYTVLVLPDRAEIRRVLGGNIVFMQLVLIDYAIGPEPGGTTNTTAIRGEVRYDFEETFLRGLGVYFRYEQQFQSRSEELILEGLLENDFTDMTYGLEYTRWKLYARAERRHRRGGTSPFDLTKLEARYTDKWTRNSNLTLQVIYQDLDRRDIDTSTSTLALTGTWNQQIGQHLWADLLLTWQNIDDTVSGGSQAFEQELNVRWQYRQTEMYAKVRNTMRDTRSDDVSSQVYIVGLRREF